jgi:predicted MPP superfamily phosphohydrolase
MIKKITSHFLVILSSSVFLLISGHFLFYLILLDVLSFLSVFPFILTISFLACFFVSIFLAQFLVSRFDNLYSSTYYFFIASLLGIFWQSVLVYFVLISARFFFSFFFVIDPIIFAWSFLGLTAFLSAYGFRNAFSPRIKEVDVEIQDLPDFWDRKKIVHLSDIHLGAVYRHRFLTKVSKLVDNIKPELVLITGDLFDGTDGDFSEAGKQLLQLHAPLGVYFIYGNHENYLGRLEVARHLLGSGIEILDDRLTKINGLQIIGISYPKEGTRHFDLAKKIQFLSGSKLDSPSILMFHEPIQFKEVSQLGVNIYLAGHTHRGQMFPFNLITKIIYHGYSFGIRKFQQMTAIISTGVGTWGPPCRTLSRSEIIAITLLKK